MISRFVVLVAAISLPACRAATTNGGETGTAAQQPSLAGTILVANQQSASATIVDLAKGTSSHIQVGTGPHETAISPDGRWGVVTVYGAQTPGNQLAVIDLRTGTVARTIDLGIFTRPHGVMFIPGSPSKVVATSEASRRVVIADIIEGRAESDIATEAGGSHMVGVTADGKRAWTANVQSGSVSEIDLERRAFVRQIPVAPMTEGVAVTPNGREVWVGSNSQGTVSVVDTQRGAVVATIPNLGFPYRIGISPDGTLAAVCDPQGGRVHVVDVASRRVLGAFEGLGSPRGVFIGPDSRTGYITLNADQTVAVVDLRDRRILSKFQVQGSPDGVSYSP
jgi:YVTN family beta-propeller protein